MNRCREMFEFAGKAGQPSTKAQCRLEPGHGVVHEARKPKGGIVKWRKRKPDGSKRTARLPRDL